MIWRARPPLSPAKASRSRSSFRNASSLGPVEFGQARGAFEAALKEAGLRVGGVAPVAELRLTLSENQSQYLLVEEAR